MNPAAWEVNFDGLVGPTHNYGGLSYGNIASMEHGLTESSPRRAALQGLEKMKLLLDLGVKQAVLPPQERPDVEALRGLGFRGSDAEVIRRAGREAPALLASCSSASSMWAANAATVSPSADASDRRVHFTPANLVNQLHRSIEPVATAKVLRRIFPEGERFSHHPPLPGSVTLSDEGAANHLRLCSTHGGPGVEIFVYGRGAFDPPESGPVRFPARQTLEASAAVARSHRLSGRQTVFVRQNPEAVDAGAFHADVIAVGNENVLIHYEFAFLHPEAVRRDVRAACRRAGAGDPIFLRVPAQRLSPAEAVRSYLFNGQLVTLPGGSMAFIAPAECAESVPARAVLDEILAADNPIRSVHFVQVRESMRNGGGPACLRLRVVLTAEELAAARSSVFLTPVLWEELRGWVCRHYRDRLRPEDLADPSLLRESRAALDDLSQILDLGSIYRFQQD